MLRVHNYGAACCVIESDSFRILCDPWLVGTAYLGTWEREHYLPDPVKSIGKVDVIWISHCHDDHYHPESLRLYLATYPNTPIYIGDAKFLERIMVRDGFSPIVRSMVWVGEKGKAIGFHIIPNNGYENDNVDTVLVVVDECYNQAVVNMNDCPFDAKQVDNINVVTRFRHVTALLPYAGAGPWPQCFHMEYAQRLEEEEKKKDKFLAQFQRYKEALKPDVAVPFSAGYVLRGPLASLNSHRGIPRQEDVPGATVLPVEGAAPRPAEAFGGYAWEGDEMPTEKELRELLKAAMDKAPKVSGPPIAIAITWDALEPSYEKGGQMVHLTNDYVQLFQAHETIHFDPRLLAGMLRRKYHANSIEIGSCIRIERHGKDYDPRIFSYLYRMHI